MFYDPPVPFYTVMAKSFEMMHHIVSIPDYDINNKYNSWTMLHLAAYMELMDFVEVLLAFGADPNILDDVI